MASRKKSPEQSSLFALPPREMPPPTGDVRVYSQVDITDLVKGPIEAPPPDDTPVVAERKLRLVPPPAAVHEEDVIVEALDDGCFVVSTLRHHGTTVAAVKYSRKQLEMLVSRGRAALEVG